MIDSGETSLEEGPRLSMRNRDKIGARKEEKLLSGKKRGTVDV